MKFKVVVVLLLLLGNMAACDRKSVSQNLYVVFAEQEEGTDPSQSRALITTDFLRLDDGVGAGDFILFDRKKRVIYSVSHESRQIITIGISTLDVKSPIELKLGEMKLDDMQDFPTLEGKKTQHYSFKSGDEVCFETLSVQGFLPAYVTAMEAFNNILAKDSMVTLNNMPADMQNGCDLAKHTYAPNRHLKQGFPIRLWREGAYSTTLLDYKKDYQADKLLFELPTGYRQINITELRSGSVSPQAEGQ